MNNYPDPLAEPPEQNQNINAHNARESDPGNVGRAQVPGGDAYAGNVSEGANVSEGSPEGVIEQQQPVFPAAAASGAVQPNLQTKSKIGLIAGMLAIGLVAGGVVGYLIGDFLIFRPALNKEVGARTALEDRLSALESAGSSGSTTATSDTSGAGDSGNTGSNQGGLEIFQGITADPLTIDWPTYTNEEHHFSFKYPSNYEVRKLATEDDRLIFNVGVFQKGGALASAFVRVYKSTQDKGPVVSELATFFWPPLLPARIKEKVVGAGRLNDVSEKEITLSGKSGSEIGALEGAGLEAKPDGEIFKAYILPDLFGATYLVGTCGSDQTKQDNLVACPLLSTFEITP